MSTSSGRAYLSNHHDVAGREFASALLNNGVMRGSKLATDHALSQLTPSQKAALLAMRYSATKPEFDAALRLAVRSGALAPEAMTVFAPPHAIAMQAPTVFPLARLRSAVAPLAAHSIEQPAPIEQVETYEQAAPVEQVETYEQAAPVENVAATTLDMAAESDMQVDSEQLTGYDGAANPIQLVQRRPGMTTGSMVAPLKRRRKANK